jgi:GT2 family glycosyltransferase
MYGEDIDLCRRIDRAGFQKILVGDALVTHLGGVSSSQRPPESALMAVRAMNRYFRQWDGRTAAYLHRALMGLVGLAKSMIFCAGGLINMRWRRSCSLYRRILRWAVSESR